MCFYIIDYSLNKYKIMQQTQKKTQVIGARIPYDKYNQLEIKCLENNVPISAIIQKAITQYMKRNKFALSGE